ncbi:MAG: hypothetical protein ABIR39_01670 [Nocardioides sp.]|uniref:hypothetical protein n=1 Tax=Nocardioides sp. TaxID=35761 RepID=UPI003267AF3F
MVTEVALLAAFLAIPSVAHLLGGAWPEPTGWALAGGAAVVLVLVDGLVKTARRRRPTTGSPS